MSFSDKFKLRSAFVLAVVSLYFQCPAFAVENAKEVAPYEISAIKAFLYFDQKGTLSENIIDNPIYESGALWNTIIGVGGEPDSASNSTMVVVEIKGKRGSYLSKRKLDFVASEGERIVLQKTLDLGVFSEKGRFYAAFWLYGTGCRPITLSAKMAGQASNSKIEKKIDFKCGE
jgi:hypothetical protein